MAVLSREDFFKKLNDHIGTDSSDESIALLEDMTDTYNDMEKRANGDGTDWKQKYDELDKSWRNKYTKRFFSTGGRANQLEPDPEPEEKKTAANITIDDLFAKKKE